MLVVLDELVEQSLFQQAKSWPKSSVTSLPNLTATIYPEEDLVVLSMAGHKPDFSGGGANISLACYGYQPSAGVIPSYPAHPAEEKNRQMLTLGVIGCEAPSLQAFYFVSETAAGEPCETEVVRIETDVFSRLKGIFDTRILSAKTVSVIGIGSGGSVGALELAKAGVGNFVLVDFDRLKAHNISRHVCGLADVGWFKTRAVRDSILQHNPQASVVCHEADITEDEALLEKIASTSDLVFVATDNELSRYLINEACLAAGTPAIYGGAYERAFAGEVVRVIPGEAGCYACVRQALASTMRSISSQQAFDYTDDSEFQAEPGLGLEVSFIAMIHAKMALMTLLKGTESALGDLDAEMIIWVNSARPQDGELFERPLTRHLVRVPKSEDCPTCGGNWDESQYEESGIP